MKVLLSAYACEPNRGSEPGVGWNWALEIEKLGHKVWVVTRKNNQKKIEKYWQVNEKPKNLHYIYYDVPKWLTWWKKGGRGVHLYYFFWQIGAYLLARKSHKLEGFDKVQHITFVTLRQPSFMGLLGIPFILGPIGGGERAPYKLRRGFGFRGWFKDFVRDIANFFVKFDPLMYLTFSTADKIYVTSEQSKKIIPCFFEKKVNIQLAIGFNGATELKNKAKNSLNILFVGHFLYLKGMGLGIQAFAKVLKTHPDARLTMIGKGPDKARWQSLAYELSIEKNINWVEWVDQRELKDFYRTHDVFLFPSLHDSGGMVVLEAMAQGLPIVCLNLGGPGIIVDATCGIKIDVGDSDEVRVTNDLSEAILKIINNVTVKSALSRGALTKANTMSWTSAVQNVYKMDNVS